MTLNNSTEALVQAFIAGGGRVKTIPEATPVTVREVLQYLQTRRVVVTAIKCKNAHSPAKFRFGTKLLNWRELLDLANRYRRKQRLPPFEIRQMPFSDSYLGRTWVTTSGVQLIPISAQP
jgi:hypothetical protein